MPFERLKGFHQATEKSQGHTVRTLAANRLAMRPWRSIGGVGIDAAPDGCPDALYLPPVAKDYPKHVPHLLLFNCDLGEEFRLYLSV